MFWRIFTTVCLPIILMAGAGWALDRFFRLGLRTLVKLNIQLFIPAFIFVRIMSSELDMLSGVKVALFTLTMIALLVIVGLGDLSGIRGVDGGAQSLSAIYSVL